MHTQPGIPSIADQLVAYRCNEAGAYNSGAISDERACEALDYCIAIERNGKRVSVDTLQQYFTAERKYVSSILTALNKKRLIDFVDRHKGIPHYKVNTDAAGAWLKSLEVQA